jgi:hypothetical protein
MIEPELESIEQLLRSCPARSPSEALDDRVSRALAGPKPEHKASESLSGRAAAWPLTWPLAWPVGAAVAAALAMALTIVGWPGVQRERAQTAGVGVPPGHRAGPSAVLVNEGPIALPVRLDHVYRLSTPTRRIHSVEGRPVRQFEERSVHRTQWLDARGDVRMEWTQPERALVLTPVNFD